VNAIIEYFSEHTFLDLLSAIAVLVIIVLCIEKIIKWLWNMFIKAYNKKKGHEEEVSTIDKNTAAIEGLTKHIEELGNLVNKQYAHLDKKIDEQKEHLEEIDRDGKRRDVTLMRDRILAGVRYFNQNRDEEGIVHISLTDFENMDSMIQEYFKAGGNGAVKHIYDLEFSKYKIDNDIFDKK
jgi:hypothetical protein